MTMNSRWSRAGGLVAFVLLLVTGVGAPPARAQMSSAEAYFELAEFEVALSVLDEMLDGENDASQAREPATWRRVQALRGRCLALLHRPDEAIEAFCRALKLDPTWVPDPLALSSPELAVFREADARCERSVPLDAGPELAIEPIGSSPWYRKRTTLGVAAAVVATAVIVWTTGGDDEPSGEAPPFPDPPEGP